jgi:hypothetical protein
MFGFWRCLAICLFLGWLKNLVLKSINLTKNIIAVVAATECARALTG